MPLKKYQKVNIFDINTAQTLNGYITSAGYFTTYQTNGLVCIPITNGATYDISGIVRVNASTEIKYATFSSIPIVDTMSIRYGTFAQSETLSITAGTNENYILIMFCGDSDYSAYGSVQNAFTINCANMQVKTLQWTDIPYRRYETATDAVTTLPVTLYTDGQPIAANLFDTSKLSNSTNLNINTGLPENFRERVATSTPIDVSDCTEVTLAFDCTIDDVYFMYSLFSNDTLITRITEKRSGDTINVLNGDALYICFYKTYTELTTNNFSNIMLNEGSTALPYQPYAPWVMKGNTETSGNPSPSNPITISGVGNRTANLFDTSLLENNYNLDYNTGLPYSFEGRIATLNPITYSGITSAILTYRPTTSGTNIAFIYSVYNDNTFVRRVANNSSGTTLDLSDGNKLYVCFFNSTISITTDSITDIMLNTGSTALDYEPYGYKISIASNQTALNPMYLSGQLMKINDTVDSLVSTGTVTYNIKELVLTGEEEFSFAYSTAILPMTDYKSGNTIIYTCTHYIAQEPITSATSLNADSFAFNPYANSRRLYIKDSVHNTLESFKQFLKDEYAAGTPVTVYYVLATPTTESVTAPSIPTTGGEVTLDIDTTVKPSELDLTYHGWHSHEPQKFVDDNISPITEFTNTTTDTRDFIRLMYMTTLGGTVQQNNQLADISTNGSKTYTVNISKENNNLTIRHSGASSNIAIFTISGGVPIGTYTLSFDVQGHDCSTVGGVVLSNIVFKDANGGHWE